MGSEQSNTSKKESRNVSKDEVNQLLALQREAYEQRLAEMVRTAKLQQQKDSKAAQQAARDIAQKEAEKIVKQKQMEMELMKQKADSENFKLSSPQQQTSTSTSGQGNSVPHNVIDGIKSNSGNEMATSNQNQTTGLYPVLTHPLLPSAPIATTSSVAEVASSILIPLPRRPTAPPATRGRSSASPGPRQRSASRNPRSGEEDLSCPSCQRPYRGHIYQCVRGHSSCADCKQQGRSCGARDALGGHLCGHHILDMRNITLEAYAFERKVHCINQDAGCCVYIKSADMEQHQSECPFREMICPLNPIFGNCSWKGKLTKMAEHFDLVHPMHRQGYVDTECFLMYPSHDSNIVYLVSLGNFQFLFHVKVSEKDQMVYMAVLFLGTAQSASKWTYRVDIYDKSEPTRKFQYQDVCRSSSLNALITNHDCASIPFSHARSFIKHKLLTYKFYITKDIDKENNNFRNNRPGRGGARRRV